MTNGKPYTSGQWLVTEGSEDSFIAEWTDFTEWSLERRGAEGFFLLQRSDDPRRFLSFGAWEDSGAVKDWRSHEEFADRLGRCRSLCDEFEAHDYTLASAPGRDS